MAPTGYAALWQDGGAPLAGSIYLDATALVFEGSGPGRQASRRIDYDTIASVALSRASRDRVAGRPALVLRLTGGMSIRVATPELGVLHELEEALAARGGGRR
jgi:hypothetical protein